MTLELCGFLGLHPKGITLRTALTMAEGKMRYLGLSSGGSSGTVPYDPSTFAKLGL